MGVLLFLSALFLSVFHCAESPPARFDLASASCLHDVIDRSALHVEGENVRSGRVSNPNDSWTAHLDVTEDETPDDSSDPAFLPSMSVEKAQFRDLSPGGGLVRIVPTARKEPLPLRC